MHKKITRNALEILSKIYDIPYSQVMMLIGVESSGKGFSKADGRMIIHLEPSGFQKSAADWKRHKSSWKPNQTNDQEAEWEAYNKACEIDVELAMLATRIGIMQVIGFDYKTIGFDSVAMMWVFAKKSEANQLELELMNINARPVLRQAILDLDFRAIALHYNGKDYELYNYHVKLKEEYVKHISKKNDTK